MRLSRIIPGIRYLLCSLAVLAALGVPGAARAAEGGLGLSVDGAMLDKMVVPGQTYSHTMTITSNTDNPPLEISVAAAGLGQQPDGSIVEEDASSDYSQYSAREYIQEIDTTTFTLEPGQSQQVTATITIPEDVGEGSRYANIYISSAPISGGELGIRFAVNVPVVLTVSRTQMGRTGRITDVSASETPEGDLTIRTAFLNDGNTHYKAYNQVIVRDADGNFVAAASGDVSIASLIPTFERLFALSPRTGDDQVLPEGDYGIESSVMLPDGTLLDRATSSVHFAPRVTETPPTTESPAITQTAPLTTPSQTIGEVAGLPMWLALAIIGPLTLAVLILLWITARRRRVNRSA